MKRYGLGMEEASKALVVSLSLQRILNAGKNPVDAIQQLATKLSISSLLYDSSDEDPTTRSDDANPVTTRPGMRIEPVSTQLPTSAARKKSKSNRRYPAVSTAGSKASKSKSRSSGRKRSIDEISPPPEDKGTTSRNHDVNNTTTTNRNRADSVTEAVDAKIAKQGSTNGNNEGGAGTGAVRSKRVHRMEEPETSTPVSKRRIM